MKQAVFVIQSIAADTGVAISAYQELCQQRNYAPVALFYTSPDRAHDATRLQHLLQSEYGQLPSDTALSVFVFGGDGTVNLAVQQLLESQLPIATELVLVPLGTGNDCARRYGIASWQWLLQQPATERESLLVGRVNDQVFVNSAGLGLSADLVKRQSPAQKQRYGKFSYVVAALCWLLRPRSVRLVINGQTPQSVMLFSVGVGAYCGGGIRLHPYCEQRSTEPAASVVCITQVPRWKHVGYLLKVLAGTHEQLAAVTMYSTNSLLLQLAPGEPNEVIEVDGDILTQLPAQFSAVQTQIQIVRPARINPVR